MCWTRRLKRILLGHMQIATCSPGVPVHLQEVTLVSLRVAPVDLEEVICVCVYHALCAFMLRGVYICMDVCRRLCRKLGKPQNGCRKCCHCKGGGGSRAPDLPMYVCMYVCMYVLFKPPAHSMHDFVNLGETCCDEAGAQRGPERPREA